MTKPRALLLVAGLVLLCATAATARRTLLQGTRPSNYQCDEWEGEDIECKLNCGDTETKLDCELRDDDSRVKCEVDRDFAQDYTFRCSVTNGQVDLASCDNKASIPADCISQVDELLTAWRPIRDD